MDCYKNKLTMEKELKEIKKMMIGFYLCLFALIVVYHYSTKHTINTCYDKLYQKIDSIEAFQAHGDTILYSKNGIYKKVYYGIIQPSK